MNHYVTCYYQNGEEIKFQAMSKSDVPAFVAKHQSCSCIIVSDPRERVNTIYQYGKNPKPSKLKSKV